MESLKASSQKSHIRCQILNFHGFRNVVSLQADVEWTDPVQQSIQDNAVAEDCYISQALVIYVCVSCSRILSEKRQTIFPNEDYALFTERYSSNECGRVFHHRAQCGWNEEFVVTVLRDKTDENNRRGSANLA